MDMEEASIYCVDYNELCDSIRMNEGVRTVELMMKIKKEKTMDIWTQEQLKNIFSITYGVKNNRYEIRQLLIINLLQPVIESFDKTEDHPLWMSLTNNDFDTFELLLTCNSFDLNEHFEVDVHDCLFNRSVRFNSGSTKYKDFLDLLVEHGADVAACVQCGVKALKYALTCSYWRPDVAELILAQGVCVHATNECGDSFLHEVVGFDRDRRSQIIWLLQHGIDVNQTGRNDETPIFHAVKANNFLFALFKNNPGQDLLDVFRLLLANGARVDVVNRQGQSPFSLIDNRDENPLSRIFVEEFARIKSRGGPNSLANDLAIVFKYHPELVVVYDKSLERLRKTELTLMDYTFNPTLDVEIDIDEDSD